MFSIITVIYETDLEFWKTADSVAGQTFSGFEWIIQSASPLSEDAISRIYNLGVKVIFPGEIDCGIYNAMNIAIAHSKEEYIYFMNSGDRFFDETVLERVSKLIYFTEKPNIIYGRLTIGGIEYNFPDLLSDFYFFRNALCHQGYFIKSDLARGRLTFDESYPVLADHEFAIRNRRALLRSHQKAGFQIANVPEMGFSARNVVQRNADRKRVIKKYFPFAIYPHYYILHALTLPAFRKKFVKLRWYRQLRDRIWGYS